MIDCRDARGLIGAHLLGGLEEDETRELLAHLAACPACAEDHARLAGVVPLIGLAGPPDSPRLPEGLEQRLLSRGAYARAATMPGRRERWRSLGRRPLAPALVGAVVGAAATLAAAAALGAFGSSGAAPSRAATVQLAATEQAPAAAGVVYVIDDDGATTIALQAHGLPRPRPGQHYVVWLSGANGSYSAGTIQVTRTGWTTAILRSSRRAVRGSTIGILVTPASGHEGEPRLLVQGKV